MGDVGGVGVEDSVAAHILVDQSLDADPQLAVLSAECVQCRCLVLGGAVDDLVKQRLDLLPA